MKFNLNAPVSTLVAVGTGGVILLSYFLPIPKNITTMLLSTAVTLSGVAILLGILNLFIVHLQKIREASKSAVYSFFLIIALMVSLLLALIQGPDAQLSTFLFTYVQIPAETTLMGILLFSLVFATIRMLNRRPDLFSIVFIGSLLITLAGSGPLFGIEIPFMGNVFSPIMSRVLAGAGARGLLLGISLGTIATGLRILIGVDRPFGG